MSERPIDESERGVADPQQPQSPVEPLKPPRAWTVFAAVGLALFLAVLAQAVLAAVLAIIGFCLFGFLASFEPPGFVAWRIGYIAAATICVAAMIGTRWLNR